jgi:tetratricopeptide (TPR) repeat protein
MLEYMQAEQLRRRHQFEQADAGYHRILDLARRHLGPRHPLVALHLGNMTGMYRAQNNIAKAEPYLREALEIVRALPAMRSAPVVVDGMLQYGDYLRLQQRTEQAKALYSEALQFARARAEDNVQQIQKLEERLAAMETATKP